MTIAHSEAGSALSTIRLIAGWIASNPEDAITTFATVAIACSAVFTVFLTRTLARENRLLRKAETEPEVIAYLVTHPVHYTLLNFVLANVGRGPARDVSFRLEANSKDFDDHDVALRNSPDRKAISYLPQGEKISTFFGSSVDAMKTPRLKPFDVVIEYHDMKGRFRSGRCRLDVAQFDGFSRVGNAPDKDVADSLKKIEGHLKGVAKVSREIEGIPKLLETYIWNKSNGSDATELSEEAKAIMRAAVAGNGSVSHRRLLGGQRIQAGNDELMAGREPRTVARWVGGLEELKRRKFIRDLGHKGELFFVTREGYEAADKISQA